MGGKNRIVVDYGDYEGLVMTGCIDTRTDVEEDIHIPYYMDNFDVVKKYDGLDDYSVLKEMIDDKSEGFVIKFKSGMMMKIKGEEYFRLHRILTNISNRDIWRHLKDNKPLDDIIDNVPDEFFDWVKNTADDLLYQYNRIVKESVDTYKKIILDIGGDLRARKDYAKKVLDYPKRLHGILFSIYDGRDYSQIIWDQIFPSYSKPFKKDSDEI